MFKILKQNFSLVANMCMYLSRILSTSCLFGITPKSPNPTNSIQAYPKGFKIKFYQVTFQLFIFIKFICGDLNNFSRGILTWNLFYSVTSILRTFSSGWFHGFNSKYVKNIISNHRFGFDILSCSLRNYIYKFII